MARLRSSIARVGRKTALLLAQAATVTDALGRLVRLRVDNQNLLTFEVRDDFGGIPEF